MKKQTVQVIVQSGQYEQAAETVTVTYTTDRGLMRRLRQLSAAHAVYGDNWAGWIPARVAIADPRDTWGDNDIIGGQWCTPANGWMQLDG